jgi:hypothetical protein
MAELLQRTSPSPSPSRPDITEAIAGLTERLHAYRFVRLIELGDISVDRLTEKLTKAGGVVARVHANIEARADAVIAREGELNDKAVKAFDPHNAMLDDAQKGLDALERQLALVSNDPLPSSGSSLEEDPMAAHPLSMVPPRQR